MELDYEQDIAIDETALDVEWLEHGSLAIRYAKQAAYLRKIAKKHHERVKTIRSDLIREANENPTKCCAKSKPNAADIEAYYRAHPKYKKAVQSFINAEYEADYAELAKNEITYGRKAALENLVLLHGQQYFAGPRVPRNLTKEWERKAKDRKMAEKVGKKLKQRRGE